MLQPEMHVCVSFNLSRKVLGQMHGDSRFGRLNSSISAILLPVVKRCDVSVSTIATRERFGCMVVGV